MRLQLKVQNLKVLLQGGKGKGLYPLILRPRALPLDPTTSFGCAKQLNNVDIWPTHTKKLLPACALPPSFRFLVPPMIVSCIFPTWCANFQFLPLSFLKMAIFLAPKSAFLDEIFPPRCKFSVTFPTAQKFTVRECARGALCWQDATDTMKSARSAERYCIIMALAPAVSASV